MSALEETFTFAGDKNDRIEKEREEQISHHEATNPSDVRGDGSIARVVPDLEYPSPPWPRIPPEDKIRKLVESITESNHVAQGDADSGSKPRKITQRSQMVPEKHGGVPGVVHGEVTGTAKAAFHRCEDEPIHTPGAIQQHGVLVVLRYDKNGDLLVRICSENTAQILRRTAEELFQLPTFCDILAADQKESFTARVDQTLENGHAKAGTELDIFTLSLISPGENELPVWCSMHLSAGTNDLLVCEFEVRDDDFFPSAPEIQTLPQMPTCTLDNPFVEAERLKSITRVNEPIRALEAARKQVHTVGFMEMFNVMSQVQQQLGSTRDLQALLDVVVGLVHEVTHFHRVMIYRFDKYKNGAVDAEFVDPRASEDLFRGLHFPASDIPKQARELYKINKIRTLLDRDQETARLVCREDADFAKPLDLTHSYLRAMSPIHLKYLANMGVRSSLSISLMVDGNLWGLVACHSYGDEGLIVSLPTRELCRNIGECASTNIERLLMVTRLHARKPLAQAPPHQNPLGFIAASSTDLLQMFDADFGLLSIQDESRAIGRLEPYSEALALLTHLQKRKASSIMASDNVTADFPDLAYSPGIKSIAGLLIVPLSTLGTDFIVFFRIGQLKEVRWAGNPYEKIILTGRTDYLEPRSSFKRWTEQIVGTSREWTDDELENASILCLLYGKFIEVWRQKELVVRKGRMARLLIRNSSHEVRTPLNAILNNLEIALENPLDKNTRKLLLQAHKSSRSLIYVIDDLLNLTRVEDGQIAALDDIFNLSSVVEEAIMTFRKEAMRKGLDLIVSIHPGLPEMVKGDSARLRQALSNVTSNAFEHSVDGGIRVDIRPVQVEEQKSIISINIQDVGVGMSERQLDDLFREFEQILDENETPRAAVKPGLGLGLAFVARYVRNVNGQIKIRSDPNKGTIVTIVLPFDCVPGTSITGDRSPKSHADLSAPNDLTLGSKTVPVHQSPPINKSNNSDISGRNMSGLYSSPPRRRAYQGSDTDDYRPDIPQVYLSVLVAEDNPINAQILQRRLERSGHKVQITTNGQSCYDLYMSSPDAFDVVLMDLQMPLVDGSTSTRMIRTLEKEIASQQQKECRVPVFAVSASMFESKCYDYIKDGFDGWIPKPLNYSRLEALMRGVHHSESRTQSGYLPGLWERGGWFIQ